MKYLLLLLLPCLSIAQGPAADFADKVFQACKANDARQFEQFLASSEDLKLFIKDIDATAPDSLMAPAYTRYKSRASKGFKLWQETVRELGLDLSTAVITKTEVQGRPLELKKENNQLLKTITVTGIKIFFNCSGKKLCFIISDAILVNDKYYMGNDYVQLHWLD